MRDAGARLSRGRLRLEELVARRARAQHVDHGVLEGEAAAPVISAVSPQREPEKPGGCQHGSSRRLHDLVEAGGQLGALAEARREPAFTSPSSLVDGTTSRTATGLPKTPKRQETLVRCSSSKSERYAACALRIRRLFDLRFVRVMFLDERRGGEINSNAARRTSRSA